MQFTPSDYENMQILKDKLGTWKEVDNLLGLPHRSSTRIRSMLSEGENYNYTSDKAEKVLDRIDQYVDYEDIDLEFEDPVKRELTPGQKKYIQGGGLPSLSYKNYTEYDEQKESWVAGEFSNLPNGIKISKAKSRQIRGGSLNQIRKINKAKHFLNQRDDMTAEKAYKLAGDWQKKYQQNKEKLKSVAFQDENGAWHWGNNGQYAKVEDVKKVFEKRFGIDPTAEGFDYRDLISKYTDAVFKLRPSP